jgi:hypothetical protein
MKYTPHALLATTTLYLFLAGGVGASETVPDKVVILARHETVAVFNGISDHRCLGLTSLCPDRCGHSGRMASFAIISYLSYEQPDPFGDPQSETFAFLIEDTMQQRKVPSAIFAAINTLQAGDHVLLSWDHTFVTINGTSGPERPVTRLEKIASGTSADGEEREPGQTAVQTEEPAKPQGQAEK